jgi:hypothetical protein
MSTRIYVLDRVIAAVGVAIKGLRIKGGLDDGVGTDEAANLRVVGTGGFL